MDTLSHGLYGGVLFGRKNRRNFLIAFLFGVGPDILSFGPYFVLAFLGVQTFAREAGGRPDPALIPSFVHGAYNVTHSLIIYAVFFAVLYALGKRSFAHLTFGWPLHILVDMPTHARAFFPTPFLWPLFDVQIDGIPWSTPWIFFPNVALLIVLYSAWWLSRRRRRGVQ